MKKILIFIFALLINTNLTWANEVNAIVAENPINTHNEIYFKADDSIEEIGRKFGDDVYLAGESVTIDSVVKGDVISAGGEVIVGGVIEQDLRVAGGKVTITGQVMGNVTVAGGEVEIVDSAIIYKNLIVAGGEINIEGQVLGKARIMGRSTILNTQVQNDWEIRGLDIVLGDRFQNNASLTYYSPIELEESSRSANFKFIKSDIGPNWNELEEGLELIGFFSRLLIAVNSLFALVLGYFLMRRYSNKFEKLTKLNKEDYIENLKRGIKIGLLLALLIFVLTITLIGMGPALTMISIFIVLGFTSNIIMSFVIGRMILFKWGLGERRGFALLTGIVFNLFMSMIPLVGLFYKLATMMTGMGIILNKDK